MRCHVTMSLAPDFLPVLPSLSFFLSLPLSLCVLLTGDEAASPLQHHPKLELSARHSLGEGLSDETPKHQGLSVIAVYPMRLGGRR